MFFDPLPIIKYPVSTETHNSQSKEQASKMMFKFLAAVAPAFLATAVVAYPDYPQWITDIPVDASYEIGFEFALEWVPQDTTETFKLKLGAFNNTPSGYYSGPFGVQLPIYDSKDMYLDGKCISHFFTRFPSKPLDFSLPILQGKRINGDIS